MSEKKIKIIISDFDGIFTDGSVLVYDNGTTAKRLDYSDIMGIALAYKKGYEVVIISGEKSSAIDFLLKKFPLLKAYQDIRNKKEVVENLLNEKNLTFENVLYLGDDVNDIDCLKSSGLKFTVENANYKVKELNIPILKHKGGYGAFREAVDMLP
ncbi:HAD hydrolase family protein [bacterium]|nr:HAD hydrolase family protein [bacterium]